MSIAVDAVVLAAFAGVRATRPHDTPMSAGSSAIRRSTCGSPTSTGVLLAAQADPHESRLSAWWLLFRDQPGVRVHLGCTLVDGSFVSGWLLSYNMSADDVADRDITLAAPIHYRPPGASEADELVRTSAVVVSARQLSVLFVSHQTEERRSCRPGG